jgi:hypothetical protein
MVPALQTQAFAPVTINQTSPKKQKNKKRAIRSVNVARTYRDVKGTTLDNGCSDGRVLKGTTIPNHDFCSTSKQKVLSQMVGLLSSSLGRMRITILMKWVAT